MKPLLQAVNALVLGFLVMLIAAALALLALIATTRGSGFRSDGLFGAVYFEAEDRPDGSTWLSLGVQNWIILIVLWLGFSVLAWGTICFYGRLKAYRKRLLDGRRP